MKVLILRTFAHNRVWENDRKNCEFERGQWVDMIEKWEPNYENYLVNQFSYGLGIYTNQYFTHISRYSSKAAYSHTPEEENISILRLRPFSDSGHFSTVRDKQLFVYYNFETKLFTNPDRELMKIMDSEFVEEKRRELVETFGKIPHTPYLPLSFTLDFDKVSRILINNGINSDYSGGI